MFYPYKWENPQNKYRPRTYTIENGKTLTYAGAEPQKEELKSTFMATIEEDLRRAIGAVKNHRETEKAARNSWK